MGGSEIEGGPEEETEREMEGKDGRRKGERGR